MQELSQKIVEVVSSIDDSQALRNSHQWRAVADFLDAQWLASLGLRRLSTSESEARRQGPACGMGPQREALPVGNTGITSLLELASV